MTHDSRSQLIAGLLIAFGALVLLGNFGWLSGLRTWFWALLFLAGGGAFLYFFNSDKERWWALIPAFGLLALAGAVLMGDTGGSLFLALLGVGFAAVYANNRRRWWAIIPAGALGTLAMVAWVDRLPLGLNSGSLFFLGIAATFAALTRLPEEHRQRWALYPALACLLLAAITLLSSMVGNVIVPLLFMAVGAYLLWRRGGPGSEEA